MFFLFFFLHIESNLYQAISAVYSFYYGYRFSAITIIAIFLEKQHGINGYIDVCFFM